MSWIRENSLNFFQKLAINIIKTGKIPKHVAFIMDGNRRYANKNHVDKLQGHSAGFDKLAETLQWCLDLNIKEVTVYAFSIENFKRSDEEVAGLMKLAEEKFQRLLQEKTEIMKHGLRIRIIGDFTKIPANLRSLMSEIMIMTKDNTNALLNIAYAYTSTNEITNTFKTIVQGVKDKNINPDDINESLFSNCLYTNQSINPDLLIRTSGEARFSDFLLWQTSHSCIYFSKSLWPEFNLWDLLKAIFYFQSNYNNLQLVKSYQQSSEHSLSSFACNYIQKVKDRYDFLTQ